MTLDEWIDKTTRQAEHVLDNVTFSANTGEDAEAGRIAAYQGALEQNKESKS